MGGLLLEGLWKAYVAHGRLSGSFWEGLWEVLWEVCEKLMGGLMGALMGGLWEACGRLMGGFWEASGRLMGGLWEGSGRLHTTIVTTTYSRKNQTQMPHTSIR